MIATSLLPVAQSAPTVPPTAPDAMLAPFTDLALPARVGLWPPSWQLLVSLMVFVGLCILGCVIWWRHRKKQHYRKIALAHLKEIESSHASRPHQQTLRLVNELLKACALKARYPKHHFIARFGPDWYTFLSNTLPQAQQKRLAQTAPLFEDWTKASYTAHNAEPQTMHAYFSFCRNWIKHHQSYEKRGHV